MEDGALPLAKSTAVVTLAHVSDIPKTSSFLDVSQTRPTFLNDLGGVWEDFGGFWEDLGRSRQCSLPV